MKYPFSFIELSRLPDKPRKLGITSLLDKGLDNTRTKHLLELYGDYIDVVKLGFGTARLIPREQLMQKISLLTSAETMVCPGGTFFEIAFHRNQVAQYLDECKLLGFNAIEISDGVKPIELAQRVKFINQVQAAGFKVFVEIGRKNQQEDRAFSMKERIHEAETFMECGVEKIILEARESGNVGIFDSNMQVNVEEFEQLIARVEPKQLIFEAPHKHQQAWLINKLGSEVNLGNIAPDDILPVTCLRLGLRADTIKL